MQREIAIRLGYTSHPGMQDVERFMKHYFLIAKDVGDLTAILCAKLEDQQAKPAPVLSRMMARLRPTNNRRRVPDSDDFIIDNNRINLAAPDVFKHDPVNLIRIFRLAQKNNLAFHPGRDAHGDAVAEADQHPAARKSRSQPAVHGDPDLERRRNRAAAHERDRRARPLHPRLRQDRVDDAVQHVSPLHGRRASAALRRLPAGHRARRQRRIRRRQRPDAQDPARASRGDLHHHAAARHRQGPPRGSLDRRRQGGAAAVPAARLQRRRHRTDRLADRAASDDVDGGAVARPLRPQDHREFRRRGAVGRADEAADHPDHRRHPRRRPRGLERLEGAAAAHAVLRDRAGADRRLLGSEPRAAHRGGAIANSAPPSPNGRKPNSTPISRGIIRPTGSRSNCRARSAMPAS